MNPSATELSLLKPLWSADGLSARELHSEVAVELNWSFSSTRKTLDRMVEKGLVVVGQQHGVKVYSSAGSKVSVIAALTRDFMVRVLEMGEPMQASAFTGSKLLNDEEICELEKIIRSEGEK